MERDLRRRIATAVVLKSMRRDQAQPTFAAERVAIAINGNICRIELGSCRPAIRGDLRVKLMYARGRFAFRPEEVKPSPDHGTIRLGDESHMGSV
jgi:hypothetical protein